MTFFRRAFCWLLIYALVIGGCPEGVLAATVSVVRGGLFRAPVNSVYVPSQGFLPEFQNLLTNSPELGLSQLRQTASLETDNREILEIREAAQIVLDLVAHPQQLEDFEGEIEQDLLFQISVIPNIAAHIESRRKLQGQGEDLVQALEDVVPAIISEMGIREKISRLSALYGESSMAESDPIAPHVERGLPGNHKGEVGAREDDIDFLLASIGSNSGLYLFSMPEANFIFRKGQHGFSFRSDVRILEKMDGIVVEQNTSLTYEDEGFYETHRKVRQFTHIYDFAERTKKSLYYPELMQREGFIFAALHIVLSTSQIAFLTTSWLLPLLYPHSALAWLAIAPTVFMFAEIFSLKKSNQALNAVLSYLNLIFFFMPSGFRSAVVARKLKRYIVPEIKGRARGRKPNIFIDYGALHLDIVHYIKHPRLADFVIWLYRFVGYLGFNKITLSQFGEINFTGKVTDSGKVAVATPDRWHIVHSIQGN